MNADPDRPVPPPQDETLPSAGAMSEIVELELATEPDTAMPQPTVGRSASPPAAPAQPPAAAPPRKPNPPAGPRVAPKSTTPQTDLRIQLPNATVGKPYQASIPLTPRGSNMPSDIRDTDLTANCLQIDGVEEIGLRAELPDGRIILSGVPEQAGEHRVTITYAIKHRGHTLSPANSKTLTLTVNPDPRSLWKELEPDVSLPYPKRHTACERVTGGGVLIGASRRGRSHAHEAKFRDDEFRLCPFAIDGWHYFAVADGAGSALYSRRGAELACTTTCEDIVPHLTDCLDGAFLKHVATFAQTQDETSFKHIRNALYKSLGGVAHAAFKRIEQEAKERGCPAKDFATTLLFTLCRRFEFGWFVAAFGIGDGGVAVYRKNGGTVAISKPDSGEFAGQTRFLTMADIWANGEDILNRIDFKIVPDLTAVVAMTDGVSDPKFQTDQNFFDHAAWGRFWDDLSTGVSLNRDNERADAELLEWLNFWSVGNHDDRTIALLLP